MLKYDTTLIAGDDQEMAQLLQRLTEKKPNTNKSKQIQDNDNR